MPAILLARLKKQVYDLAQEVNSPNSFIQRFLEILDFYSNRTQRHGQSGILPPLINTYNIPKQVLRYVQQELCPLIALQQCSALNLVDALWVVPIYEFRLLAACLLGHISPNPPGSILERIFHWHATCEEESLRNVLVNQGLKNICVENTEYMVKQIEIWVSDTKILSQQLAIKSMIPLLTNPRFENLPAIFNIISPFIQSSPPLLKKDVLQVINKLISLSPMETALLLQRNFELSVNQNNIWFIRKCINEFPHEIQKSLRKSNQKKYFEIITIKLMSNLKA